MVIFSQAEFVVPLGAGYVLTAMSAIAAIGSMAGGMRPCAGAMDRAVFQRECRQIRCCLPPFSV